MNDTPATSLQWTDHCVDYADLPGNGGIMHRLARGELAEVYPLLDLHDPTIRDCGPWLQRDSMTEALAVSNQHLGNPLPDTTLAALRANGMMIIAGQQPGLLTGPLYTFLKAATVIALAQRLRDRVKVPIIPAFWIAGEDHDIEEVNRCHIGGREFVCPHEVLETGGPRPPVGSLSLEHCRDELLAFLNQQLGRTPHGSMVIGRIARADMSNYTTMFASLIVQLFGEGRLVLVDPAAIREPAAPPLAELVRRFDALEEAFGRGRSMLEQHDVDPPVDRFHLFEFVDGTRRRCDVADHRVHLHDGEHSLQETASIIESNPRRFSPSAALRPLVQDAVLPVMATIGGPAELTYLWQVSPMYEVIDLARSHLYPRISATLIDHRLKQAAAKFALTPANIFDAVELLNDFRPEMFDEGDDDLQMIDRLASELLSTIEGVDPLGQEKLVAKASQSIRYQVDKLLDRLRNQRLSKQGVDRASLQRLVDRIYPHNGPAERTMNVMDLVARFGLDFVDQFLRQVDPGPLCHHVIELDDGSG
jgi:bacillithiol biosynthesis cysteine-adding enzyme BshC